MSDWEIEPEFPCGGPAESETPPTVASLLQRAGARVLDTGIVGMLAGLVYSLYAGPWPDALVFPGQLELFLFFAAPPVVYFLYEGAQLARDGRTVGKRAVGIRVAVFADGSAPRGKGWARAAVYALPGVIPGLGYLFWLCNVLSCLPTRPYRLCLHDRAAKTVVVTDSA